MTLSVAEYNRAEEVALVRLPNRAIEAFQPTHFNRVGYPTRIATLEEVVKYAEVMHEGETARHLDLLGGLSEDEWALVERNTRAVWTLTRRLGSPTLPRASLLRSLHVLRLIRRICGGAPARIFELGPGSGYLAALLAESGYPYAGMDVSQGFYLYQHASWAQLAPMGIEELAAEPGDSTEALAHVGAGAATHLPWWHFASLRPGQPVSFDLVVCNRALCEMNPTALDFSLTIARSMLSGGGPTPKAFLFDGWGADVVSKPIQVVRAFLRAGFAPAYLDATFSTGVFVPWHFGHLFGAAMVSEALHAMDICRDGLENQTIRHIFSKTLGNPVAAALEPDGGNIEARPFGRADLEGLWCEVSGMTDYRSRDEQFWDVANSAPFILDVLPPRRRIVLFGAGSLGRSVARHLRGLGRSADAFIDNDGEKWGQFADGLPIRGPADLPRDAMILITTVGGRAVAAQLAAMGLSEGTDFMAWPAWSS